jgi:hypothetical protein
MTALYCGRRHNTKPCVQFLFLFFLFYHIFIKITVTINKHQFKVFGKEWLVWVYDFFVLYSIIVIIFKIVTTDKTCFLKSCLDGLENLK